MNQDEKAAGIRRFRKLEGLSVPYDDGARKIFLFNGFEFWKMKPATHLIKHVLEGNSSYMMSIILAEEQELIPDLLAKG